MVFSPKAQTILEISPYVGGASKAPGAQRLVKLSSNEGPFGPPPAAIEAAQEAAKTMHRYPDGGSVDLREALGAFNNIDPDHIVCGAGSDEIIELLCNAYCGVGDEIVHSAHGFLMYGIYAKAAGAQPVAAPEKNLKADPQALLECVNAKTKIVFLANPNNPTGSYLNRDEVIAFRESLPENVLLVLDAAYCEYVTDEHYTSGHDLVDRYPNIVVTRTFSKIYGLGGLRLGWGHCAPEIIDILNRVRGPFNVSSVAQAAGLAALQDTDFIQKSVVHNTQMLRDVTERLQALGLTVYPSAGNFMLVDFETEDRAGACCEALKAQGILVRQVGAYGLPSCLRVSMGLADEMDLACAAIKTYCESQ